MTDSEETQARLECLIQAVKSLSHGVEGDATIVERARKFFDFVNGDAAQKEEPSEFAKAVQQTPENPDDEIPF